MAATAAVAFSGIRQTPSQYASSSIGRAAVSKTAGWGFESLLACHGSTGNSRPLNSRIEPSSGTSPADLAKYALAIALAAAGVFAFYWFRGQWPDVARVLSVAGGVVAGIVVFLTTRLGARTLEFLGEARFELRKVVWPKRQEATRTTWVVIAVVVLISLLLMFFDVVVQAAIKWLLAR